MCCSANKPWLGVYEQVRWLLALLALFHAHPMAAQENGSSKFLKNLRPTTVVDFSTSFGFQKPSFQKSVLDIKPEWRFDLGNNSKLTVIGRLYTDFTDHLEPGKPQQTEISKFSKRLFLGTRNELELREAYLDLKIKKSYLRIGKQQIVWGEADGIRVMDIVNPFYFREFLNEDFDNARIPLGSLKWDIPYRWLDLQLVFIPDLSYHVIPGPKGIFFPEALIPPFPQDSTMPIVKKPRAFSDSDVGFKVSTFWKGWDLSWHYLYHYNDFAIIENRTIDDELQTTARYSRIHTWGLNFNNSFKNFTFRGELGINHNAPFNLTDGSSMTAPQLVSVLGLDYSGFSNTLMGVQLFQDAILKSPETSIVGRSTYEPYLSLFLNRTFKNSIFEVQFLGVGNLKRTDVMLQTSAKYQWTSKIAWIVSTDFFLGARQNLFGQFKDLNSISWGFELGI